MDKRESRTGWQRRRMPLLVVIATMLLLVPLAGCGRPNTARPAANWRRAVTASRASRQSLLPSVVMLREAAAVRLADDTFPFIAQAQDVSQDRNGEYVVADVSDKDIKVYDRRGRRIRTIGAPGVADSAFVQLGDAELAGDTVVAFDAARQRVLFFGPGGQFVRTIPIPPPAAAAVRVLDDSLLLYIARMPAGPGLLRIVHLDGRPVSSFFSRAAMADIDPLILFHTHLMADGADGIVVVGVAGTDSIFVFDYEGRQLAAGLIDAQTPLPSLVHALEANNGRARRRDGNWYYDGARFLFRVVVLDASHVLEFIAPYNTRDGTDLVQGGTILALTRNGDQIRIAHRWESLVGLFGRSPSGGALYLGYADTTRLHYAVMLTPIPPPTSAP